jgi:chaperonin GroES
MTLQGPVYSETAKQALEFLRGNGRGSTGLAIQDAQKNADALLDTTRNSLKDDSVFVPMGDRVAVKRIADAEISSKGIILPQSGKTPPAFGVVVGVGQGRYNLVGQLIPCRVEVGAVIMFGKYAGTDLPLFGVMAKESCVCLREEEIMGVVMSKEQAEKIFATSDPTIHPVTQ